MSEEVRKKTGTLPPSYHDNEVKLAKIMENLLRLDVTDAKTKVLEWNQTALEKIEENLLHLIRSLESFELVHKEEAMESFSRMLSRYDWQYGNTSHIPLDNEGFSRYLYEIETATNPDTVFTYFAAVAHLGDKEILSFNNFLSETDQVAGECTALLTETIEGLENRHHTHAGWRTQTINRLRFQEQNLTSLLEENGGFQEEEEKCARIAHCLQALQGAWAQHPLTQQGDNPQNMRIIREFQRKENTLRRNTSMIMTAKNNLITHQMSVRETLNKLENA